MKTKLILTLFAATAALTDISSAVTVTLQTFANSTVGFVTLDGALVTSGRAVVLAVTNPLTGVSASMNALLASQTSTSAQFDTALNSLITSSNTPSALTNPGIVASRTITNGAISPLSASNVQVGDAGNLTYLFLVAESEGFITGIGAYTGAATPSVSVAVIFNPTNANDGLEVGTSIFAGPSGPAASGFQLAAAVPEPSAALLGALGALGLLRRRRI